MKPTAQQSAALNAFSTGESLKLEACAGSGKTATLRLLSESTKRSGLYMAFNREIQQEAARSFPQNVACKTSHGLAFAQVGRIYARRLAPKAPRLTPKVLAQGLGLPSYIDGFYQDQVASLLIQAMRRFCHSGDPEIALNHIPPILGDEAKAYELSRVVQRYLKRCWETLMDERSALTVEHDMYLKKWALQDPDPPASFILFDEAQDANALQLHMLERWQSKGAQIVAVGDRYQQIYSWRGAVNAMSRFEAKHNLALTRSFRYGQDIADLASSILGRYREAQFLIEGEPSIDSTIYTDPEEAPEAQALLCRTNAYLLQEVLFGLSRGRKPSVAGGVKDITQMLKGTMELQYGRHPASWPEFSSFSTFDELVQYAQTEEGQDLGVLMKLIEDYEISALLDVLRDVEKIKSEDADLTLSTAHKSKGLEWDSVCLASDFVAPLKADGQAHPRWSDEEAHLLYVAVTRAKRHLDVSQCSIAAEAHLHGPPDWLERAQVSSTNHTIVLKEATHEEVAHAKFLGLSPDSPLWLRLVEAARAQTQEEVESFIEQLLAQQRELQRPKAARAIQGSLF